MIPDLIAAIPDRIPVQFGDTAPGHRFNLYFTYWEGGRFSAYKDARLPDIKHLEKPERERIRTEFEARKRRALSSVCPLGESAKAQVAALRARQQALIAYHGANGYRISTTSSAPFSTGLGNEHPIENGFAFLTPYGLPYLAGSGVKGILRRAMQELRDDEEVGFTDEVVNALFGPEKVEAARRGALDFWDVFPNPGDKLVVEIMTPHYSKYYQGEETPHDSGAPVPVSFLAVPAKSQFDFHVICHPSRLPESLKNQWRVLLDRAFQHAFEWVGFGAKTSVGYGAMADVAAWSPTFATSGSAATANTSATATASSGTATQTWPTAKLTLNPGNGEIKASFETQTTVGLKGVDADRLRAALGEERANKLKKNKELKGVSVEVEPQGNALQLKGLSPT